VYANEWKDVTDRRDPSGYPPPWVNHLAQAHHLLDDHDIVYTTTPAIQVNGHLPNLPDAGSAFESTLPTGEQKPGAAARPAPTRFEFTRRGQRCGDVGWGCFQTDPNETATFGRTDGHGLVGTDLNKKHQFMRLSGDPCFDMRAGRLVPSTVSSLRKPATMEPKGKALMTKRGS